MGVGGAVGEGDVTDGFVRVPAFRVAHGVRSDCHV